MSRIHDSLQARYQGWAGRHFELTKAGRSLKQYKDLHKGEACFLIGNGPSLRAEDLTRIHEVGIPSFAMNRIFNIFSQTPWRPTYYVCEDENIALGCEEAIAAIPAQARFLPAEIHWYHGVNIPNASWFHINYRAEETINEWGFSGNAAKELGCRGTVTFTCMQLAVYMGFSRIYLLGVDHNYQVTIDLDGNVVTDPNAKDYFCEGYDSDIKENVIHDMGQNTRAYLGAKGYLAAHRESDSVIYNATRGGKLEVFPRADFDQVILKEKGAAACRKAEVN